MKNFKKILGITAVIIVAASLAGCSGSSDVNSSPKTLADAQTSFMALITDVENTASGQWTANTKPTTPQPCSTSTIGAGTSYQYSSTTDAPFNVEGYIDLMKKHLISEGYKITASVVPSPKTYHLTLKQDNGLFLDFSANANAATLAGTSVCITQ